MSLDRQTRVLTEEGYKSISKLSSGQKVWTVDDNYFPDLVEIESVSDAGLCDNVIQIHLSNLRKIVVSSDQLVALYSGPKKAAELTEKDIIVLYSMQNGVFMNKINEIHMMQRKRRLTNIKLKTGNKLIVYGGIVYV